MSIFDKFGLGKKKQIRSRGAPLEYKSKLGNKHLQTSTEIKTKSKIRFGAIQLKGRLKNVVWRYLNILLSDIKILCSIWKPREKIIYKDVIVVKDFEDLSIEDLYE